MSVEMKNLNINGTNFEIVDAKSRSDIGSLKSDVVNNITNPDEYPLSIAEGIIQATMEIGGLSRTDGSETDKTEYVRLADYFAVESGKTYTFANSGDFRICVLCYDSNLVFIEGWNKDGDTTYSYAWIGSGGKLKIPSGASYIRFYCNASNDLSVVYTISEDGATQSSKVEFVKQYFKNHGYAIYGDNIDNETMHKLVIEALGQHGNTYNITEIKAPNSNPQEATLCLMNSGNGKTQFVDISSMVYDENNPTVEIVNQVRGGKKLPEFSIRYNDGQGAGKVKKLTVKPDAIPVEFTSEGIKVRRNNEFNNNATDDEIVTINMAKLHDDVETLETDLGVERARVDGLKGDLSELSECISVIGLVDILPVEIVRGTYAYKYSETVMSFAESASYGYKKYNVSDLPSEIIITTFTNSNEMIAFAFVDGSNNIKLFMPTSSKGYSGVVSVPSGATYLYINFGTISATENFNPYGVKKYGNYTIKEEKESTPTKTMVADSTFNGYYMFSSNTVGCVKFEDNTSYTSYMKRVKQGDVIRLASGYFAALAGYILTDDAMKPYFVKHTTSSGSATYDDTITIEKDGYVFYTEYGTSAFYEQGTAYINKEDISNFKTEDVLKGKKIFFDGDSITMASGGGVIGYVSQIERITGCITQNLAVDGGTLTSGTTVVATGSSRHHVCESILNSDADTDIYCISGGYNDFGIGQSDIGTYIEQLNSDLSVYDTTTLYGALDYIFTWLMVNRSGKPILFIMTHNPLNYRISRGSGKTANITLEQWFEAIKKMCKKYSVPYVNLFDETPLMTKLDSLKQFTVNNDGVHPTTEGYKRYYVPKIISALHSICPIDFN